MNIRRTTYTVRGEHVSLPFIATLADEHPETIEPPPAPESPRVKERRGPREPVSLRSPRMTAKAIRRALGKDPDYSAQLHDRIRLEAVMRRIERGGA